jgi:hypothetical protein
MALLGGLLAVFGRFFGKIANMALGWATVLLFGRVPQSRQVLLTVITLGSLAWVLALIGVLVPDAGAILLAAIPRPDFVDEAWIRIAMLVLAVILPVVVGSVTILLLDADQRPHGADVALQVLRGYPYAAVLAITLVFLAVIALVRKARSLGRRWEDAHIAVLVKPGGYERVVADLEAALGEAGIHVQRMAAPRPLTIPPRLLGAVGGSAVKGLVPDELVQLETEDLEVLVYPSDVALLGSTELVARARAAIATRLTFTEAYLTSAEEAQELEDRLAAMAGRGEVAPGAFRELDERLATLAIPYEEWETLYRLRLHVENHQRLPDANSPGAGDRGNGGAGRGTSDGEPPLSWVAAAGSVALLAADVALALAERRQAPGSRNGRGGRRR